MFLCNNVIKRLGNLACAVLVVEAGAVHVFLGV